MDRKTDAKCSHTVKQLAGLKTAKNMDSTTDQTEL